MGWFFRKALARLSEPSTYLGVGVATLGVGQAFDWDEAPAVAETAQRVGDVIGSSATPEQMVIGLGGAVVAGIAAFLRDPGSRE